MEDVSMNSTGNGSSYYYVPLAEARQVLADRESLRGTVEAWWKSQGIGLPPLPQNRNLAVLARQVATFRYEDVVFQQLAVAAGLDPLWLELTSDKMSAESNYKKSLVHPVHFERFGRNGGMVVHKDKMAGIEQWNGTRLRDVFLDGGVNLVEHHHVSFDSAFGADHRADNAGWMNGRRAAEYYPIFLSLCVAHCAIFEDYHGGESGDKLSAFTQDLFEPTFKALASRFGVKPLIVRLPWIDQLRLYPPDQDWQRHGVLTDELLHSWTA